MMVLVSSDMIHLVLGFYKLQAMAYLLTCGEQGGGSSPRAFHYFLADFQKASR